MCVYNFFPKLFDIVIGSLQKVYPNNLFEKKN